MTEKVLWSEPIIPGDTKKFIHVGEKIKNKHLGDDTAWEEMREVLTKVVPDFPDGYSDLEELLRTVFSFRRRAYLSNLSNKEASEQVIEVVKKSGLNHQQEEMMVAPMVVIRDLLYRPSVAVLSQRRGQRG